MESTALLDRHTGTRTRRSALRAVANILSMIGVLIALSLATSSAVAAADRLPDTAPTSVEARFIEPIHDRTVIAQEDDGEDRFDEGDDEFGGGDDEGEDRRDEGDDDSDSSDDDYDLDDGEDDEAGCRDYDDGEDRCLDTCADGIDDGEDHLDAGDDEYQGSAPCVGTTETLVDDTLGQLGANPAAERTDSVDGSLPLIALGAAGLGGGALVLARRHRSIG